MKYICLDTNVLLGCALINEAKQKPEHLEGLRNAMQIEDVQLLMPEVIINEFESRIKEKKEEIENNIKHFGSYIKNSSLSENDYNDLFLVIDGLIQRHNELISRVREHIEFIFQSAKCHKILLDSNILVKSYIRQISKKRPFNEGKYSKNRIMPISIDCVIIESLIHFLNLMNDSANILCFCSGDKDFYENESYRDLHPDIKNAIPVKVNAYRYLPNLLHKEFGQHIKDDQIKEYIRLNETMVLNYSRGSVAYDDKGNMFDVNVPVIVDID